MSAAADSSPSSEATPPAPPRFVRLVEGAGALALHLWLGGLLVAGAVVAPLLFRELPRETAAPLMTRIFERFHAIGLGLVIVFVLCEVVIWLAARPRGLFGWLRGAAAAAVLGSALTLALTVTPTIASLHRAGARRGVGADGARLDQAHRMAESLAGVGFGGGLAWSALTWRRPRKVRPKRTPNAAA
ncbi:MAG: DUF4149 domain-containing protein [Deltaproteobacteria bacterium]|nr:DUF4149 domain-containing protein [Deltaproteobacteria bacterium]